MLYGHVQPCLTTRTSVEVHRGCTAGRGSLLLVPGGVYIILDVPWGFYHVGYTGLSRGPRRPPPTGQLDFGWRGTTGKGGSQLSWLRRDTSFYSASGASKVPKRLSATGDSGGSPADGRGSSAVGFEAAGSGGGGETRRLALP